MGECHSEWLERDRHASRSGAPSSATDERHVEQVKSVLERVRSIACTAAATKVDNFTANAYHILTSSMG
jgi:hypothetical protein